MQIKLKSFDTLFVRDGKPFSMGDEVWANGIFPPPPSVIYGALRTAYFSRNLAGLEKAGGSEDPTNKLQITRLLLTYGNDLYFPCPYDIVKSKAVGLSGKDQNKLEILQLQESNLISSYPTSCILETSNLRQPITSLGGDHFLEVIDFENYLNGEIDDFVKGQDYFFIREPKIGIQKSRKTGSSEDGKLYRVEMFRPKQETNILVEWKASESNFQLAEYGFLKIGGEGKAVSYSKTNNIEVNIPELEGNKLKIIFATPVVFENGWLPGSIDPKTLEGTWQGHRVKVLAAAFDRSGYLGGFEIKTRHRKGGPKPMRKVVPAGAVYYLETKEKDVNEVAKSFHGYRLGEFGMDQEGYGLAFVGKVK